MSEDPTYDDVIEEAEPYDEDNPTNPLEVYVKKRETRRRSRITKRRTRTRHKFYVLDHARETVAYYGRWTTPGKHHNPYEGAKARAFGFLQGFSYGRREHKRIDGELPDDNEFIWENEQ